MGTFHRNTELNWNPLFHTLVAGSPVLGVLATHNPWGASFVTGMKTTVSEAEHPLLCERHTPGRRRPCPGLMICKDGQARLKKVRGCGTEVHRQRADFTTTRGSSMMRKGLFFKGM